MLSFVLGGGGLVARTARQLGSISHDHEKSQLKESRRRWPNVEQVGMHTPGMGGVDRTHLQHISPPETSTCIYSSCPPSLELFHCWRTYIEFIVW